MSRRIYQQRAEAVEAARALARETGRPVFWGRYPGQKVGYTVPLIPSGDARELVSLTLPPDEVRRGREWWNAVRWFYYLLAESSTVARSRGLIEEARELDFYADHLADRTGLSRQMALRERDRARGGHARAQATERDMARQHDWKGDREPPGADPIHPGGRIVRP
jgi:hypothetical protein